MLQPGALGLIRDLVRKHNAARAASGEPSLWRDLKTLAPDYSHGRSPDKSTRERRQAFIGDLRQILAEAGVQLLRPDLVIMDEFQRFAELLDPNSTSKSAELLRTFISSEHKENTAPTKVLLLSATPYRWFDRSGEGSHHEDFISTLRFLFDSEQAPIEEAQRALAELRSAIRDRSAEDARAAAERSGSILRRVISRTERLSSTPDRNGMLHSPSVVTPLCTDDVRAYIAAQQLGDRLQSPWVIDLWKTTPWIANLGDGYKMTEELLARCREHDFSWADPSLLDIHAVGRFDELAVPNPRLRWLIDRTVNQGWNRLLWLPPARPYYATNNEFDAAYATGITKQLIFSSWRVAPKAIALGVTYAAEQSLANKRVQAADETDEADEWASAVSGNVCAD